MHKLALLTATAAVALWAGAASAAPVYNGTNFDVYLGQNTFPDGLSEQKIFLNSATNTKSGTGQVGSQNGTPTVSFTTTGSKNLDFAEGFATIKPSDNTNFKNLTISVPGYYFEDLIFSTNVVNTNKNLTIQGTGSTGWVESTTLTAAQGLGNGENHVLALADPGKLFSSITISSTAGIDDAKQFQVSGLTPIPLPAALPMFLAALAGLGLVARRPS